MPAEQNLSRNFVESVRDAARIATRQTFGPFMDEPDSPFYRAEGLDPEETWERLAEQVAIVGADAALDGLRDAPLDIARIERWHADVFGELFPETAGRFRVGRDRGQFGLLLGTREAPVPTTYASIGAQYVRTRLREVFAGFEAFAREDREFELAELVDATGRVYVKFLNLHPFEDGNGRVAYILLQFLLARLDLPFIALDNHEEHQWAIGLALRRDGKQTYAQLSQLLTDKLREAEAIFARVQASRREQDF